MASGVAKMDAQVQELLNEINLGHHTEALANVGVRSIEDFQVLDEADFITHCSMNLVECRKLAKTLAVSAGTLKRPSLRKVFG